MRTSEKRGIMILIGISVLIIIILMFVGKWTNKKKEEGRIHEESSLQEDYTKKEGNIVINTSEKINENKKTEEFEISNVNLKEVNGETILSARVKNNTAEKQEKFLGNIVLLDKENKGIVRIPVRISETKAGETIEIEASITGSYVNAYDYRIER